jgi:hypothetical protein
MTVVTEVTGSIENHLFEKRSTTRLQATKIGRPLVVVELAACSPENHHVNLHVALSWKINLDWTLFAGWLYGPMQNGCAWRWLTGLKDGINVMIVLTGRSLPESAA